MILFPNAKINLGLNVVSRRPDGYHNIETLFYPTQWCDILEITPASGAETTFFSTGRHIDCPPEKNLVMKAVAAFRAATGSQRHYDLRLHKMIPDGAGLGGGSADAAFALRGLNELEESPLDSDTLALIAGKIGADCAFFIYNRPMFASGIGTELTPAPSMGLSGMLLAIVKPGESVSTAEAYRGVTPGTPAHDLRQITTALTPDQWSGKLVNDFEASVFPGHPCLAAIKDRLTELGAVYAAMSGSGSAIFGLFAPRAATDRMAVDSLKQLLADEMTGCAVHVEELQ